jgi:UDP-N-acetylmuramoylalanine--D-glutamate ligase
MKHLQPPIAILGAAESGLGAAILAQKMGYEVWVSDIGSIKTVYREDLIKYKIPFEENQHSEAKILQAQEVIISPGISFKTAIVQKIKAQNIPLISEIEFASRYTNAHITAVTGSNGKTTTATLIYQIMKNEGLKVALAGNIGDSFARKVATEDYDYYVLEISSFQLDSMYNFRANTAIILNITPDHLDRYNYDFNQYAAAKMKIGMNQKRDDAFIYYADDHEIIKRINPLNLQATLYPFSQEQVIDGQGAYRKDNQLYFNIKQDQFNMDIEKLALQGRHNANNTMASGIATKLQEIRKETIKNSFSDFQGIPHRLEKVTTVRGITFINDSKATNVNSTWYALESMTKPVVLIMGGQDKGNDYSSLISLAKEKVKAIVCLGLNNETIIQSFSAAVSNIIETSAMNDAVLSSFYLAEPGDVVLLSPACASFDLFENFEDRGDRFKRAVQDL